MRCPSSNRGGDKIEGYANAAWHVASDDDGLNGASADCKARRNEASIRPCCLLQRCESASGKRHGARMHGERIMQTIRLVAGRLKKKATQTLRGTYRQMMTV